MPHDKPTHSYRCKVMFIELKKCPRVSIYVRLQLNVALGDRYTPSTLLSDVQIEIVFFVKRMYINYLCLLNIRLMKNNRFYIKCCVTEEHYQRYVGDTRLSL